MSRRSDRLRATIRKQGATLARAKQPLFSLPKEPRPPAVAKADLRAEAERAAAEWKRRYDPTGE